jgi:hypothetical protein
MDINNLIKAILPINCKFNFEISSDGKCYSKTCALNENEEVAKLIEKDGCSIYKKFTTNENVESLRTLMDVLKDNTDKL